MDSRTKRKLSLRFGFWAGAAALLAFLAAGGCRIGIPDYTLTVVVEDGVTGTPEAGQYVYQELTTVDFDYEAVNPLHSVEVMINGIKRSPATGSVVLYGDGYELRARLIDLRGDWKMTLAYNDEEIPAPGEFTITLSGPDIVGGTFTDSRGFTGVWSTSSDTVTLTYDAWFDYVLTGEVYGMKGTFTGEELTGTWTAVRPE
ncbi:MAG: hypothetical protein JW747_09375 [Candidatus Aminicenantes bacterium]|nr:hypothetical protein [Candidatus Aminicenantes bacterium]